MKSRGRRLPDAKLLLRYEQQKKVRIVARYVPVRAGHPGDASIICFD